MWPQIELGILGKTGPPRRGSPADLVFVRQRTCPAAVPWRAWCTTCQKRPGTSGRWTGSAPSGFWMMRRTMMTTKRYGVRAAGRSRRLTVVPDKEPSFFQIAFPPLCLQHLSIFFRRQKLDTSKVLVHQMHVKQVGLLDLFVCLNRVWVLLFLSLWRCPFTPPLLS